MLMTYKCYINYIPYTITPLIQYYIYIYIYTYCLTLAKALLRLAGWLLMPERCIVCL